MSFEGPPPLRPRVEENDLSERPVVPLWADIILFLLWCGCVAAAILSAYPIANLLFSLLFLVGGAVALLGIRHFLKSFLTNYA